MPSIAKFSQLVFTAKARMFLLNNWGIRVLAIVVAQLPGLPGITVKDSQFPLKDDDVQPKDFLVFWRIDVKHLYHCAQCR